MAKNTLNIHSFQNGSHSVSHKLDNRRIRDGFPTAVRLTLGPTQSSLLSSEYQGQFPPKIGRPKSETYSSHSSSAEMKNVCS
jgi:hypothetical protein